MADNSAGQIALDLVVNRNKFDSQMKGIQNIAAKAGKVLAVAFSVKKLSDFGKECIDLGSNLAEVQNVVDVTFTSMSEKVDKFAKSAAASFGMSETMAKKYTGTFGAMAKSFGFSEKQAYDMSTALTGLAGDVASFYNMSHDEAYTKLKSVFTGETESLKELGAVMTQTALDQYALANGFGKTTAKMTEAEKVSLRYSFVQKQLSAASGDFLRTQDSWANQTRILSLQIDSLKANIGQGLINVLSPLLVYVNKLIAKFSKLSEVFSDFTARLAGKKNPVSNTAKSVSDVADNASAASSNIESIGDSAKKAAKEAEKSLMGFDQMNKIGADTSADTDTTTSGGGGNSSAGADTTGVATAQNAVLDKTSSSLDKLKKKFDVIKGAFARGFNLSTGNVPANLKTIRKGLKSIYDSLSSIAGDERLKGAVSEYIYTWTKALGSGIGMFVSVGTALATNLVSGISTSLDEKKDVITTRLVKCFNIAADERRIAAELFNSVSDILSNALTSRHAVGITTSLSNIFIEAFTATGVIVAGLSRDLVSIIADPIIKNKGLIKKAITNTLSPIDTVLKGISNAVSGVGSTIVSVYDDKIHPAALNIRDGITQSFAVFLDTYNKYVAPVMKKLSKKFKDLWEKHLGPCFEEITKAIGNIILIGSKIFKEFLAPLSQTLTRIVLPVLAQLANVFGTIIVGAIKKVVDRVKLVFSAFNALCDGTLLSKVKSYFIKVLNNMLVVKLVKKHFSKVVSMIHTVFSKISSWFGNKFKKAWENIKKPFAKAKEFFSKIKDHVKNPFTTIVKFFKDKFEKAWSSIKDSFSKTKKFFSDIIDAIKMPFMTIAAFFKWKFHSAWDSIKNSFSKVKKFFSDVRDKVKEPFLKISTFFKDKFGGAWDDIKDKFKLSNISDHFKNVLSKIKKPFENIADWFKDKFQTAWQNVKDVFSTGGKIYDGIKDGISDTFKSVVNTLISGINTIIAVPFDKINQMLNDVRDVEIAGGVHPFTKLWDKNPLTVPQIPKLATGGYVKANTPQLAMIGDNRHQGEVVAPEDKLLEMAKVAASMAQGSNTGEIVELLKQILYVLEHLNIDVNLIGEIRSLFKVMQKESNDYTLRTGKKAF